VRASALLFAPAGSHAKKLTTEGRDGVVPSLDETPTPLDSH